MRCDSAKLKTVHYRHHNVAHDKAGHTLTCQPQSVASVGSLYNVVGCRQQRAQIGAYVGIIVYYKYCVEIVVGVVLGNDVASAVLQYELRHGFVRQ